VLGLFPIGAHTLVALCSAFSAFAMATSTACWAAMTACCALAISGSGDAEWNATSRAVGVDPDRNARSDAFAPLDEPADPTLPAPAPLDADWPDSALSSVS
jgi:hypothetical protein